MNDSKRRRIRDQSSTKATLINEGCKINGEITGDGNFMINGEIVGDCDVNGTVTLAQSGYWQGCIRAGNVVVAGQIEGDITANGKVGNHEYGPNLRHRDRCEAIAVAEGAVVEGAMKTTLQATPLEFTEKREN